MWKIKKRKHTNAIFQEEIEIVSVGKQYWRYSDSFLDFILAFLLITTAIWCFITGLHIQVYALILNIGIFGIVMVLFLLFHNKKYLKYFVLVYMGLSLIITYQFLYEISQGYRVIANQFAEYFNVYYDADLVKFLVDEGLVELNNTIFIIFFLSWFLFLFFFLKLHHFHLLSVVLISLLLALPLSVGQLPNSISFALYFILALAMIGGNTHGMKGKTKVIRVRASGLLFAGGIVMYLIILLLFKPSDYQDKVQVEDIKSSMQTTLIDFSKSDFFDDTILEEWFPYGGGAASGGLNGGKLGRAEQVVFSQKTALVVTGPLTMNERTYLRGYVGVQYLGDNWGQLSKEEKAQYNQITEKFDQEDLSIDNMAIDFINNPAITNETWKLDIENINTGKKSSFLPYYTKNSMHFSKKGRVLLDGEKDNKKYSIEYYPVFNRNTFHYMALDTYDWVGDNPSNVQLEEEYRSYVYDVYTKNPDLDERIKQTFEPYKMQQGDYSTISILNCVQMVVSYLHTYTEYSLSPGMLPQGEDFVDYFLFENKKGYCTHYASSAAVLLRYLGIPTRYVEGYVISEYDLQHAKVSKKDGTLTMKLKDTNAHAWVEVYLSKLGWVPIEVTPGYGGNTQIPQAILEQIEKKAQNPVGQNIPGNAGMPYNNMPTPTGTTSQLIGNQVKHNQEDTMSEYIIRMLEIIGVIILVLIVVILVGFMKQTYWHFQRKKVLRSSDNRAKIRFITKYLDKLFLKYGIVYQGEPQDEFAKKVEDKFQFLKQESFHTIFSIILKAGFSEIKMEEKHVNSVVDFFDMFCINIYKSAPRRKRVVFKIFGYFS